MNSFLTEGLNSEQEKSVLLHHTTNALILAGAGSGKTRVLTHRIAHLLSTTDISIANVLALTFTNKAAGEMRQRLSEILRTNITQNSWVGTFHSVAHKLLRLHFASAGLDKNFQIIDSSDQNRIIKNILKELHIDDKKFPPRQFISFISRSKDDGLRYSDIESGHNFFVKKALEVFAAYEEHCKKENLIDFAEILIRSYELLQHNSDVLERYQAQFKHILVDEFQDTNSIQYKIIALLKNEHNSIFCVGDDDQSIYGWRGAKIENIRNLSRDFAPLEIVKLEQNYRSTGNILKASNTLIANNSGRMSKELWTSSGDGEPIAVLSASDEKKEAQYIASVIQENIAKGMSLQQHAVLYRSNALSRGIEESFMRNKIQYVIYGGLRFFDRAEIKDALSYLRLITDTSDNIAFNRIVNFPARGIGNATLESIASFAGSNFNTSLFVASKEILPTLTTRAANALGGFIALIESLQVECQELPLSEKIETIINKSGLLDHYLKDKTDKTGSKPQNLKELVGAAQEFKNEDETMDDTIAFIASSVLDSDHGEAKNTNSVQLMTIHAAKGLEFDNVFVIGMEEDLFPSRQSKEEPHLMDEERRLCYVAMTRAKQQLTLSFAKKRFLYGNTFYTQTSRFLGEIPSQYLTKVYETNKYEGFEEKNRINKPTLIPSNTNANQYTIGGTVVHKKFGLGKVINYEGGENPRVEVDFVKFGSKWLIVEYAKLEKL
jgi:DNA helicase-2/ATP-dependent DNA helicase PcrA